MYTVLFSCIVFSFIGWIISHRMCNSHSGVLLGLLIGAIIGNVVMLSGNAASGNKKIIESKPILIESMGVLNGNPIYLQKTGDLFSSSYQYMTQNTIQEVDLSYTEIIFDTIEPNVVFYTETYKKPEMRLWFLPYSVVKHVKIVLPPNAVIIGSFTEGAVKN